MKVLFITSVFPPVIGGAGAVMMALAMELGADSAVAAPVPPARRAGGAYADLDRSLSFPVVRVPPFMTVFPKRIPPQLRAPLQFGWNATVTRRRSAATILSFLSQHPVDVICVNSLIHCYWLPEVIQARFPALKVVFYLHGEEVASQPKTRLDRLARERLLQADAIVTVSRFTRDRARAWGLATDRITVIHNGVDTDRFTPGAKDTSLTERFGLAKKQVLLCLARFDRRKGQDVLLQAMPAILKMLPETVLLLVGGGDDASRLRSMSASLGIAQAVRFAGVADEKDLAAFFRLGDVYVMPNRTLPDGDTEGFGLTFLEAGACGKPVIGGRAGGVPDAIIDGQTGLLVDGTSTEEVAQACIRLLRDRALAAALGRQGIAHAAENTWKKQAARFRHLCERLCGEAAEETKGLGEAVKDIRAELVSRS